MGAETADRIEQEVDEGQATSEDYTIFVAKPPPTLGSGGAASAKHAVDTYRAFFENVASRAAPNVGAKLTTSTRSLYAIPEDATVSEVVLIKNTCYMELVRIDIIARILSLSPPLCPPPIYRNIRAYT